MQGSPYFSELARHLVCACALSLLLMAAGCVTVQPQDKEYLAEPAMTWGGESLAESGEAHVLDNREGSIAGGSTTGGGCGCN